MDSSTGLPDGIKPCSRSRYATRDIQSATYNRRASQGGKKSAPEIVLASGVASFTQILCSREFTPPLT